MQKIFALLLAELKKLGANVVFADFSHIIVETGKHQLAAAQGYCDYLVKILKSRWKCKGVLGWVLNYYYRLIAGKNHL